MYSIDYKPVRRIKYLIESCNNYFSVFLGCELHNKKKMDMRMIDSVVDNEELICVGYYNLVRIMTVLFERLCLDLLQCLGNVVIAINPTYFNS